MNHDEAVNVRTAANGWRAAALFAVKAFHSLAFWVIQTAIVYLIYKGVRRETDLCSAIATSIAAGETLIYAGNGFRCPLTGLAERLGAKRGSVTDIYLPGWLARNIANIYGPMFALGLLLHARNVRARVWDQQTGARNQG